MALRAAAVAVCLVLAGCGALGGASQPAPTDRVTPAPVPEATASVDGRRLGPGLRAGGVTSASALADAHLAAAAEQSYTLVTRGTVRSQVRETRLAVESERRYRYRSETSDGRYAEQSFVTGTTRYVRQDRPLGIRYATERAVAASEQFAYLTGSPVERYFADGAGDVSVVETTGGRRYEVVLESAPPAFENVTDYRAEAVIRPNGLVSSFAVSYRDASTNASVGYTFRYSRVGGTTVERPEWVAEQWPNETATPSS